MLRAVTGKRFFGNRVQRVGIAAAAIGVLAIGTVGAVALRETVDGHATRVTVSTKHALPSVVAHRYAFREEDAWQPPSVEVAAMTTVTGAAHPEANGFPIAP